MPVIAYFLCLLGLFLGVFIYLIIGFSSWPMISNGAYAINPFLRFSIYKRRGKIGTRRADFREILAGKPISIIHYINNHIKTLYAYFANFKYHKKRSKNHSIVGNMDYLYV